MTVDIPEIDKLFSRVAHIFHQNWCGIRSAAGVQPGHKVAIPLDHPLKNADLLELVSHLKEWRVEKAAFHGFSHAAERVLRAVRAADIDCYLVWHGNLSQLVWEPEVQFFERALIACRQGFFRQAHMMKAGMGMVFPRTYEPMLLNCPPLTNRHRLVPAFAGKHKIALVSAFPDIRKNLHSESRWSIIIQIDPGSSVLWQDPWRSAYNRKMQAGIVCWPSQAHCVFA